MWSVRQIKNIVLKGGMKRMFKALKVMLLYAFLCFIIPFVKLYEMCAEYKKFYR